MNRGILISIMAIGLVGAGIGSTTMSMFSDTEISQDNEFTTGQLDLLVDWEESYNGEHVETQELTSDPGAIFELEDVKPGDQGEATISLHLEDNPGWIWMNMVQTANENVECPEPQQKALGVDSAEDCPEEGHLGEYLEFTIFSTDESGELHSEDDIIFQGTADQLEEQSLSEGILLDGDSSTSEAEAFPGAETSYVGVKWNVPLETGNIIQGDMKKFDISFYTEQERHNENPENPFKPEDDGEDPVDEKPENEFYQVDLVEGEPIENLGESTYHSEERMQRFAHGGPGQPLDNETEVDQVFSASGGEDCIDSQQFMTNLDEDTVSVNFDVHEDLNCKNTEMTLVSYEKPYAGWIEDRADEQEIFDSETHILTSGSYCMTVDIPDVNDGESENHGSCDEADRPLVPSGNLTFNDQEVDEGQVTINNVSTNADTTVLVTYEDDGDTIFAGSHNAPADLENFDPMTVDIDQSGVPGEYTARMIQKPIQFGYSKGDVIHEKTMKKQYFSQSAQISAHEAPEPSGSLTFNDQEVDDGQVTINNVSTNVDTTVIVTYQDGNETIAAGFHNAPADLENFDPMNVEIDESGVPGEHTARMIEKPIQFGYSKGDSLNESTLERQYFSQNAQISAVEEECEEPQDPDKEYTADEISEEKYFGYSFEELSNDTKCEVVELFNNQPFAEDLALEDLMTRNEISQDKFGSDYEELDSESKEEVDQAYNSQFKSEEESTTSSDSLSFSDQNVSEEGTVEVNDVTTNQDSTVFVTYESEDGVVNAGAHGASNIENFDGMTIELEGPERSRQYTAHIIPTQNISSAYDPGDTLSDSTASASLFAETANIVGLESASSE